MNHLFPYPKMGRSWLEILEDPLTRKLLGHDATMAEKVPFVSGVHSRFKYLMQDPLKHLSFAKIGYTALEAFLQANCTGPPLDFDSLPVIIPEAYHDEIPQLRDEMLRCLSVDGIDVYPLTPRIELFWLAKCMMDNAGLAEEGFNGRRARMRINFWHQKLLPEFSDTLRSIIYHDASVLDTQMSARLIYGGAAAQEHMVEFLVERGVIRIHFNDEELGREDLLRAAKLRDFEFALTGIPGKRTKHQEKETSQLVVMAKSRDHEPEPYSSRKSSRADGGSRKSSIADRSIRSMSLKPITPGSPNSDMAQMFSSMAGALSPTGAPQPENIPLNDDTLFENVQFNPRPPELNDPATDIVTEQSHLPITLAFMDPNEQPQLFPMDAIILLAIASSITNTQAADGLTREEALPYATRVLEGGSSNWAVYSQALLLRSRIEGYRSRTAERGLLQLQALVDQVIAETSRNKFKEQTTKDHTEEAAIREAAAAILPAAAEEDERSTVAERMRFIHQVSPPLRWELESELAARWAQMGGLKTALEIYERLHKYAEVALCMAATDREAEAVKLLKTKLFADPEQEMKDGDTVELLEPLPSDAPRLLCILGDLEKQPKYYNLAWTVSSERYARAKKSLGVYYLKKRDLVSAVESYEAALRIARQDSATWFSLGCVFLELEDWQGAAECFSRVVQLDDKDAQAWSNMAVAFLKLPAPVHSPKVEKKEEPSGLQTIDEITDDDDDGEVTVEADLDPYQHTREALRALRRAAHLKREDARIWDNYLTVAASIPPDADHPEKSTPWQEVIHAMSHVIGLRHKKEGESCIDLKILDAIMDHVTGIWEYPTPEEEEEEQVNGKEKYQSSGVENTGGTMSDERNATEATDANTPPNRSRSRSRSHSPDSPPDPNNGSSEDIVATLHNEVPRTPFIVRALTTMLDTQISPLATSSPQLFLILSHGALWRHRPAESLALIEKSWRATTNSPKPTPTELVESTATLVNAYKTLGPMERERTGGLVEKGWKFKSKSAVRSVMGKAKGVWDDAPDYKDLEEMMEEVSTSTTSQ